MSILFFPGATFYDFLGGTKLMPIEHMLFFQDYLSVGQTNFHFHEVLSIFCSIKKYFSRISSSNRYQFFRKLYQVIKHIRFSRPSDIGIFQEGTLRRTDNSAIGLSGCIRRYFELSFLNDICGCGSISGVIFDLPRVDSM